MTTPKRDKQDVYPISIGLILLWAAMPMVLFKGFGISLLQVTPAFQVIHPVGMVVLFLNLLLLMCYNLAKRMRPGARA